MAPSLGADGPVGVARRRGGAGQGGRARPGGATLGMEYEVWPKAQSGKH